MELKNIQNTNSNFLLLDSTDRKLLFCSKIAIKDPKCFLSASLSSYWDGGAGEGSSSQEALVCRPQSE